MESVLERLTIIPVSHVSRDSIYAVRNAFNETNPDVVAVELCSKRFHALMERESRKNKKSKKNNENRNIRNGRKSMKNMKENGKLKKQVENERLGLKFSSIKRIGLKGFLFGMIASFIQNRIGKSLNIEPGSEMLEAVNLALKNNKQIALVDQDIEVTLKKLSKNLTLREKLNFLIDIVKGFFGIGRIKFDIYKIPEEELIKKIIEQIRSRYPGLYKVLIEERNDFIAKKLFNILIKNKNLKVMAVLGAGHKVEIINIIKELEEKLSRNQIEFTYSFSL
ncbi:MAG: TraB/GumN family protein [Candidatus Woesearchaeota archaeon]